VTIVKLDSIKRSKSNQTWKNSIPTKRIYILNI
jgi:hypothetical protein